MLSLHLQRIFHKWVGCSVLETIASRASDRGRLLSRVVIIIIIITFYFRQYEIKRHNLN